jgi:hypothetical protein
MKVELAGTRQETGNISAAGRSDSVGDRNMTSNCKRVCPSLLRQGEKTALSFYCL